jgi:hypothetical protein
MLKRGSRTPWGSVQYIQYIAEGIQHVSTAGHGGIKLDRKRNSAMPEYLRCEGGWYEEDCDWAKVAVVYPSGFTPKQQESAKNTLQHWCPEGFEAFFQCTILPGHSHVKDEKAFQEAHKNDWVVVAASGDWHANVPKGFVGVTARLGGKTVFYGDEKPEERYFLVPDAEYDNRSKFGFVINPTKHKQIDNFYKKAV